MPPPIRLVLVLHNHQPVGNFDGVFEAAYQDSYAPFLEVLAGAPDIPIVLHTSGSLMEWLAAHHPEYLDRLAGLHARGQVEILGGAYYEPILTMIPPRDRVGQIQAYTEFLEARFGCRVRGFWVAERVWEQCLVTDLVQAGIEYTVLDDYHFKNAGLVEEQLHGYYLSEDNGYLLKIFPGSERLRYTIPFADPEETIAYLAQIAERHPGAVVVFADDGEKLGTWPETKKHVYEDGWLARFFAALRREQHWIRLCTFAEAVEQTPPVGKIYLPQASYREMTEWALPTEQQLAYEQMVQALPSEQAPTIKRFLRGGYWRNFKVKYPEADEMYTRMLQVSERVGECAGRRMSESAGRLSGELAVGGADVASRSGGGGFRSASPPSAGNGNGSEAGPFVEEARRELYRGQCNCAYWHGAFGGLYLPHLRQAVYQRLIAADNALEEAAGRPDTWVDAQAADFNLDARQEVRLANDKLVAFLAPARGGQLYELDLRAIRHNLLATLARRPEAYHQKILEAAERNGHHSDPAVQSIHDRVVLKQPHLERKLQYDSQPRKSLLDHFWPVDISLEPLVAGRVVDAGDFLDGVYEPRIRRNPDRVQLLMVRSGKVQTGASGPVDVKLTKAVTLEAGSPALQISYLLEGLPATVPLHFGIEFHFAGLAAGAPDRFFYTDHEDHLGPLESQLDLADVELIGLVDQWLGLDVALGFSQPSGIWTFPIQTVSNSERGFELVHQSTAVVPHWLVEADAQGRWRIEITLSADTSAAEARQHPAAAPV